MNLLDPLKAVIAELRAEGRLPSSADALIALVEGLAAAVEAESDNAGLWKEYRAALGSLMAFEGDGDDDTQRFLLEVRTAVVHPSDAKPADARPGRRGGGKAVGSGVDAVAASRRGHRPRASS